jgi:hypothetical protein
LHALGRRVSRGVRAAGASRGADRNVAAVARTQQFFYFGYKKSTPEKALKGIQKIVADVVTDLQASGEPVPVALAEKSYSGEFRVRIPPLLHRNLALMAAEQGVSLNRLASAKLAA